MNKSVPIFIGVLLLALSDTGAAQEKIRIGIGSVSLQSVLPFIGKQRGLFRQIQSRA